MAQRQSECTHLLTPVAWPVLLLLAGVCVVVHILLCNRFGFHLDELYFMECARHPAFGYVDHPPLVPWMTGFAMTLFGENLFAVRLFPALAAGAGVLLTGLMTREFGGGRYAQGFAALAALMAPAYLRSGGLLCIPVFELLFWSALTYCVAGALRTGGVLWWIAAGLAAGLGLLTKYGMALWVMALAAGVLATASRRRLTSPWPWLGALLALGIVLPHLVWESVHAWPSLEFLQNLRGEILVNQSRAQFLIQQVINMLPLLAPLWAMGLWFFFFSPAGARVRAFGWAYVFVFLVFFIERGKGYYLAPAYTVLFAGGSVQFERVLARNANESAWRGVAAAVVTVVGSLNALFALPVIPLEASDRITAASLGRLVDPQELTREFHSQYGWQEYAEGVNGAYEMLTPAEKRVCTILALKYSQASAVNFFGNPYGLPRAVSGHMNYHLWGPDPGRGEVAIAVGFSLNTLQTLYGDVREVGRTFHPLARQEYNDLPIYVCRDPRTPLDEAWAGLKRYYHTVDAWRDQAPDH